jgi:hypothetical protein
MRSRITVVAALVAGALLVPATAARSAGGITPLSPKSGAIVPKATPPTFTFRINGSGRLWVNVCKSKRRDAQGTICSALSSGRATRGKDRIATFKATYFDFPGAWLNTPGTYYWQAYRVACRGSDCKQEGPITKFQVG